MEYTELEVWKTAVEFAVGIYRATAMLPREERFGLSAQMCRAAVSVASNIAEGEGRKSRPDHAKFVVQARGSLFEVETQIVICERLGYFDEASVNTLRRDSQRVGQLINGTLRYLRRAAGRGPRDAT
jgi:four helix bundle protein